MLDPEDDSKRVIKRLPFIDPHEYIEFLWQSQHIVINDESIQPLASSGILSLQLIYCREYWNHFRRLSIPWAVEHPASDDAVRIAAARLGIRILGVIVYLYII